jgi:hypothetical protein
VESFARQETPSAQDKELKKMIEMKSQLRLGHVPGSSAERVLLEMLHVLWSASVQRRQSCAARPGREDPKEHEGASRESTQLQRALKDCIRQMMRIYHQRPSRCPTST